MAEYMVRLVVSLSQIPEIRFVIRATIVLAVALALLAVLGRARASLRALVLTSAFGVLALMPLAATVLSPVSFSVPIAATQAPIAPQPPARISIPNAVTGEPRIDREQAGSITWRHVTGTTWRVGTVLFLLPMVLGWWRLAALRRQAVMWPGGERIARELARGAGVRRAPRVLLHRAVAGPLTYGVIKPVVLMPGSAPDWHDAEIRRALTHELEHLARADWPTQITVRITCAFYWWHPLTWIAWRRLRLEAERACDDAVLVNAEPATYAAQLVRIARQVSVSGMASVLSMAGRTDLARRVSALLDVDQARGRLDLPAKAAALLLAAGVTFLVAPLSALQGRSAGAATAERLAFEMASVKPSVPGEVGRGFDFNVKSGRLEMRNQTLKTMITFAYGDPFPIPLAESRLSGGPGWLDQDRFTLEAKAAEGTLTVDGTRRIGLMLRTLLEERFGLVVAVQARPAPVYALVRAPRRDRRPDTRLRERADCDFGGLGGAPGRSQLQCATMKELAFVLSELVGRPVVDQTGLTGRYDGEMTWAPAEQELLVFGQPTQAVERPATVGPSIFTALEEQLGLELQPAEGKVEYFVVRSAEKPVENGARTSGNNLLVTVRDPLGRLSADVPLLLENAAFELPFVGQGFTDRNGRYQVRVPPGRYVLTAPVEFFPATQITVRTGEVTEQTVRMEIESTTATFTVCIDCSGSESYAPPASIVDEFRNDREAPLNDLVVGAEPEVGWEFYQPQAPDALRRLGAAAPTGTVIVEGYIATDGRVRDLRAVLATYPALASAATATLEQTRWRPARVGGIPVEVPLRITFEYTREAR